MHQRRARGDPRVSISYVETACARHAASVGDCGFPRLKLFLLEPMPQNRAPRLTTYLPCEYVGLDGPQAVGYRWVLWSLRLKVVPSQNTVCYAMVHPMSIYTISASGCACRTCVFIVAMIANKINPTEQKKSVSLTLKLWSSQPIKANPSG